MIRYAISQVGVGWAVALMLIVAIAGLNLATDAGVKFIDAVVWIYVVGSVLYLQWRVESLREELDTLKASVEATQTGQSDLAEDFLHDRLV